MTPNTLRPLYVFGNEYLADDSMARQVASQLEGVQIIHSRIPDDLLEAGHNIRILDVVKGIDKPMLITDLGQLKVRNMISLHDFDVAYFLNLMHIIGQTKDIKIIGVPPEGDAAQLAKEVQEWL